MAVEMPEREHGEHRKHICSHLPCKCHANGVYCGEFCKSVEESCDDRKCGCGHMECDATKQMGNESTFSSTGS